MQDAELEYRVMEERMRRAEKGEAWAKDALRGWQDWAEEVTRVLPTTWRGGSWSDNARATIAEELERLRLEIARLRAAAAEVGEDEGPPNGVTLHIKGDPSPETMAALYKVVAKAYRDHESSVAPAPVPPVIDTDHPGIPPAREAISAAPVEPREDESQRVEAARVAVLDAVWEYWRRMALDRADGSPEAKAVDVRLRALIEAVIAPARERAARAERNEHAARVTARKAREALTTSREEAARAVAAAVSRNTGAPFGYAYDKDGELWSHLSLLAPAPAASPKAAPEPAPADASQELRVLIQTLWDTGGHHADAQGTRCRAALACVDRLTPAAAPQGAVPGSVCRDCKGSGEVPGDAPSWASPHGEPPEPCPRGCPVLPEPERKPVTYWTVALASGVQVLGQAHNGDLAIVVVDDDGSRRRYVPDPNETQPAPPPSAPHGGPAVCECCEGNAAVLTRYDATDGGGPLHLCDECHDERRAAYGLGPAAAPPPQGEARPHHLVWSGVEWADDRCGCRYHPDDDNGSHGGAPHVHRCSRHEGRITVDEPPAKRGAQGEVAGPPGEVTKGLMRTVAQDTARLDSAGAYIDHRLNITAEDMVFDGAEVRALLTDLRDLLRGAKVLTDSWPRPPASLHQGSAEECGHENEGRRCDKPAGHHDEHGAWVDHGGEERREEWHDNAPEPQGSGTAEPAAYEPKVGDRVVVVQVDEVIHTAEWVKVCTGARGVVASLADAGTSAWVRLTDGPHRVLATKVRLDKPTPPGGPSEERPLVDPACERCGSMLCIGRDHPGHCQNTPRRPQQGDRRWVDGSTMPRAGRWAYLVDRFHRYHEDGSPWCGEGPRLTGESKTPGNPWCGKCMDMSARGTPEKGGPST